MVKQNDKQLTGKIYSYLRFSTPEQQLGDSERRQLEMAQEFAAELGAVLDETLVDRGLSGYHAAHKKKGHLGRFLERVERGEIPSGSILVIENVDRLSREPILDAFSTVSDLLKKDICIQTLSPRECYDKASLNGGLIYALIGQMHRAHDESKRKSERITASRDQARKSAREHGKILTGRCPQWLRVVEDKTTREKTFDVIPELGEAVVKIFELKLEGMGLRAIAKYLNIETTWESPRNTGWRASYIKKILANLAVIGEYQPYKRVDGKRQPEGDPIPGYYPSIVDTDSFFAVQEQMKALRGKGGRTGKAKNLFVHLVKCAYCGGSMMFEDKGKPPKGYKYLTCDRARLGFRCQTHYIRYDEAEALILENCKGLRPEQVLPDPDSQTQEIKALNLRLQGIAGSLATIEPQIGNLVDRVAQTTSDSLVERYEAKIGELEQEKALLVEQQKQLTADIKQLQRSAKSFTKWKQDFKQLLKSLDDVEIRLKLRQHLKELIDRIEVFPVGFKEIYHPSDDSNQTDLESDQNAEAVPSWYPGPSCTAETTGHLMRKAAAEENELLLVDPQFEELVGYVEAQCMSKRGRFYRVFFHSGSWIDLVPEGSLARGWRLVKDQWQYVEVDFTPLLAEFKAMQPVPVGG